LPWSCGGAKQRVEALLGDISARQGAWFDDGMDKLDRWAEDKRIGLKADLREHDDTLKSLKRDARQAASLPEKLAIQKKIKHGRGRARRLGAPTTPRPARSRHRRRL
jgi:hypothetical protein